jgi:hypothetical protein
MVFLNKYQTFLLVLALALVSFIMFALSLGFALSCAFLCGFVMIMVSRSKKLEEKSVQNRRYRFSFARIYYMYVRKIEQYVPKYISDIIVLVPLALIAFGPSFSVVHAMYIFGGVYYATCEIVLLPRGAFARDHLHQMSKFFLKIGK